ncbi:MAG: hypothetical protein EOP84_18195 [Verrucomicrobiaceae bacterium]|nr:MAG: hypothetical protein EOP84_18195 [Verrucomicrobiaceae bacterium]
MSTDPCAAQARKSIVIGQALALVALVGLPFTMRHGIGSLPYLATAIPVGAIWLMCILQRWRKRSEVWGFFGWFTLLAGNTIARELLGPISYPTFFQWLCLVTLIACGPSLIFHSRVIRFCRVDEQENV